MSQGIFGIINYSQSFDNSRDLAAKLSKFLEKRSYRHTRLSIETGNHYILGMKRICENRYQQSDIAKNIKQKSLCLMNGEINNYEILHNKTSSDYKQDCNNLDLALYYYHRYGREFARQMDGLFSIGILDQKEKSFILLNDRFGMAHQVYWTVVNEKFYSEAEPT